MILVTDEGLFGPYAKCVEMSDRVRVWPVGSNLDGPGADLPLVVIGNYIIVDPPLPAGFSTDRYTWVDGQLALK